ncbi:hypothetical protein C0991_002015 [Blastosporella zonata]|nr:hypothetical protein C0991_002015 [Blastosporella zonata]
MVMASGAKTILAFNEPDFASQSIDPAVAAQLWMQYIQPLAAHGIKLGARSSCHHKRSLRKTLAGFIPFQLYRLHPVPLVCPINYHRLSL